MDFDLKFFLLLFVIGFVGSFISGILGIGGSILKYPMLLYIPPLLGFVAFSPHQVSGISAIQVFFATMGGVFAYRKSGYLNRTLIIYMGMSIVVGSFVGGYGSRYLSEDWINLVYGLFALLAAIMMFVPTNGLDDISLDRVTFNKGLAVILSLFVGLVSGIVGAAGAFLLVPIMLVILKIPTRMTIASSLAVTFLSSIGVTIGKITTGQVEFLPALIMVMASLMASPLGGIVGKRIDTKLLQVMLAIIISATAIQIWIDIL